MSKIRVILVDDHSMVREGFRLLLETQPDIEVVGEAGDGRTGLESAKTLKPDVVLMDITMPSMSGMEATRLIKASFPEIHVLAITGDEDESSLFRVLDAGASGYVLKGSSATELISAVRTVAQGEVFLQPPMARRLVSEYLQSVRSGQERDALSSLSDREREVLQLVARGYTNQDIAARLTLSPSTVQTHRVHGMEKLGLRTRADLIRYAVEKGLLQPEA